MTGDAEAAAQERTAVVRRLAVRPWTLIAQPDDVEDRHRRPPVADVVVELETGPGGTSAVRQRLPLAVAGRLADGARVPVAADPSGRPAVDADRLLDPDGRLRGADPPARPAGRRPPDDRADDATLASGTRHTATVLAVRPGPRLGLERSSALLVLRLEDGRDVRATAAPRFDRFPLAGDRVVAAHPGDPGGRWAVAWPPLAPVTGAAASWAGSATTEHVTRERGRTTKARCRDAAVHPADRALARAERLRSTGRRAEATVVAWWTVADSDGPDRLLVEFEVGSAGGAPARLLGWSHSAHHALPGPGGTFRIALADDGRSWVHAEPPHFDEPVPARRGGRRHEPRGGRSRRDPFLSYVLPWLLPLALLAAVLGGANTPSDERCGTDGRPCTDDEVLWTLVFVAGLLATVALALAGAWRMHVRRGVIAEHRAAERSPVAPPPGSRVWAGAAGRSPG